MSEKVCTVLLPSIPQLLSHFTGEQAQIVHIVDIIKSFDLTHIKSDAQSANHLEQMIEILADIIPRLRYVCMY